METRLLGRAPAKMGTSHIFWEVGDSGYAKFAMKNEDVTRVAFLRSRYELIRPPNPILSEDRGHTKGNFLVDIPCADVIQRKLHAKKLSVENTNRLHENLASSLHTRATVDGLKREMYQISEQLRSLSVMVSTNPFLREKALSSFDCTEAVDIPLVKHGVRHTLEHFPSLRSVPRFTKYIKNDKGL